MKLGRRKERKTKKYKKKTSHDKKKTSHHDKKKNSHYKMKNKHSKGKKSGGDNNAHGHDGEHAAGEIIHDAASQIAEISALVIFSSYLVFGFMVILGYSIRSCRQGSITQASHSYMNMAGGFDDPAVVNAENSLMPE